MDFEEYLTVTSDPETRAARYEELINAYYDWSTSAFPEMWGSSLHFAVYEGTETFLQACENQERFLLKELGLDATMKVLDLGSGLGGPACFMARESGAFIQGIDLSTRRAGLATEKAKTEGLAERTNFMVASATKLPFPDETFDASYSTEVAAHVPNKMEFFNSAYRVLKPGGHFVGWDWVKKHVPQSADEQEPIDALCKFHGIAALLTADELKAHLAEAGFEIVEFRDLAEKSAKPWWHEIGRRNAIARMLSKEKRTGEVEILLKTAEALVRGGERGILTPLQFWKVKKPG
jgi:cyclopropane fatty-acyl-phospholipid synthase-like methyltransferase